MKYEPFNKMRRKVSVYPSAKARESRGANPMKTGIHPEYVVARVECPCGKSWETRSTKPVLKIEVCSSCHPYFTGEQRIIDTEGRVERFKRRYGLK